MAFVLLSACTDSTSSDDGEPGKAALESGRVLYTTSCQSCHGDQQGVGRLELASSHGPEGHTWHHADGQLLQMVLDGTDVLQASVGLPPSVLEMPPFKDKLTQAEVLAILSYLKTWWTEQQRDSQAAISRQWQEANSP